VADAYYSSKRAARLVCKSAVQRVDAGHIIAMHFRIDVKRCEAHEAQLARLG
jgi:hypothetical protein